MYSRAGIEIQHPSKLQCRRPIYRSRRSRRGWQFPVLLCACLAFGIRLASQTAAPNGSLENRGIAVLGGPGATIRIRLPGLRRTVLRTTLAAEIGRHWITAGEYPRQSW